MIDDDGPDPGQQWENEYAQWCEEQEERETNTLNALLRAIVDGTVYDPRNHEDKR